MFIVRKHTVAPSRQDCAQTNNAADWRILAERGRNESSSADNKPAVCRCDGVAPTLQRGSSDKTLPCIRHKSLGFRLLFFLVLLRRPNIGCKLACHKLRSSVPIPC